MLFPLVINLNPTSFNEMVEHRKGDSIWVVDFYASWCGPCQQLSSQWRKLAKLLKEEPNISIAQMDCQEHSYFCNQNKIQSYPTIRLYPSSKTAQNQVSYQ